MAVNGGEISHDDGKVAVKNEGLAVNGGEISHDGGKNQDELHYMEQIKVLINNNNRISVTQLAEILNLKKRTCERIISSMQQNKEIKREGTPRGGYWIVLK